MCWYQSGYSSTVFYFHKSQWNDATASSEDPGPVLQLLSITTTALYFVIVAHQASVSRGDRWLPQRKMMTPFHVISYQGMPVIELWGMKWVRIAFSLTDTSQFHTYGLDGGMCGLLQTLFSVGRAGKKFQKIMHLFFLDHAHKLQVTSAVLESHLSNKNSCR